MNIVNGEGRKRIEIEAMLFGDFRVQVWDERDNSMLDREYFCRSHASAEATALAIQADMHPDYPVYTRVGSAVFIVKEGDPTRGKDEHGEETISIS